MANSIIVICKPDQVKRVKRLADQTVWINVAIVPKLLPVDDNRPILVIGSPDSPEYMTDPKIGHVVRGAVPDDQLQAIITAIASNTVLARPSTASPPQTPEEARLAQRVFAASRKLAVATDLASTEGIATQAIAELLDAENVHCLFYNFDSAELWSETKLRGAGDDRRAVAGLAGFAARTGLACAAEIAGDDPRYVGVIDDPEGDPASPILVQPVIGADDRVHAVFVVARRPRRQAFLPGEQWMLARFAALAVPLLDQLSIHVEGQQLLEEQKDEPQLFRAEAVAAMTPQQWGDVVRVSPGWLVWAYRALVLMFIATVAFVSIGRISTYSSGPAIIRSTARTSVTVRTSGNVSRVEVNPGDSVTAGEVIAHMDDIDQRATVERTEREFETQLRNHMLDPTDAAADSSLRALRLQLEQARTAFEERVIRASTSGIVSDVRVRSGQHVEPGEIAAGIVDGTGGLEIIALLPGEDRPQLAPGMPLRLELAGYSYSYQSLLIDSVSSDVLAPNEAARILGADVAGSLRLAGPVVVVHGRLSSSEFEIDGRKYNYHDGMLGTAEVPVRTERIGVALIPGLRRL